MLVLAEFLENKWNMAWLVVSPHGIIGINIGDNPLENILVGGDWNHGI